MLRHRLCVDCCKIVQNLLHNCLNRNWNQILHYDKYWTTIRNCDMPCPIPMLCEEPPNWHPIPMRCVEHCDNKICNWHNWKMFPVDLRHCPTCTGLFKHRGKKD